MMASITVVLSALFVLNGMACLFVFLLFLRNNQMKQTLRKIKGEVGMLSASLVSIGQHITQLEDKPLSLPEDNHYVTNSEAVILKILGDKNYSNN